MKAELNKYPYVTMTNSGAIPALPDPGTVRVYIGQDGRLYEIDSSGVITVVSGTGTGTGGGSVNTINGISPISGNVSLSQDTIPDGVNFKQYPAADRTKLAGIQVGATANSTDTFLRSRANHTGFQSLDTTVDSATRVAMDPNERVKLADFPPSGDVPSLSSTNYWSGSNVFPDGSIPVNSLSGLDSSLDNYMTTNGIPVVKTFTFGTTPPPSTNTLWVELAQGTANQVTFTLVTHQGSTTPGTAFNFNAGSLLQSSVFLAIVTTGLTSGTSLSPAPLPTGFSGRGLTWNRSNQVTGVNNPQGNLSMQIYKGVGTPTSTGSVSVAYNSAVDSCHVELVSVNNVSQTLVNTAYSAPTTGLINPTVTQSAASLNTNAQLLAVSWNAVTQSITADPGTPLGGTPDFSSSPPAIVSRASYRTSAATTNTWTKSGAAQYIAAVVDLLPV